MPFNTPRHLGALTCAFAIFLSFAAQAADIGGSIRFGDENFSLTIKTIDQRLHLQSRGCNNFDLTLLPAERNAAVVLRDQSGRNLGTIANERMIETRTCGNARYSTDLVFDTPTSITWTPQTDELIGGKRVKYAARLTPQRMTFDPPIELTVYEKNSRARPLRIADVASAEFQNALPALYSSNAVHFATPAGTIERKNGLTSDDEFFLESESQRFKRPANGHGEVIVFEAPNARTPTSVSLYYPVGGPNILAFTSDEGGREATPVKSLRVDDEQLLTPSFAVAHADSLTFKRDLFRFASGDHIAQGSVQVALGSTGADVTHIYVTSSDPTAVQLAAPPGSGFSPSIEIPKLAGGTTLDIAMRVRKPPDAPIGTSTIDLTVMSDGGLKRTIPITVNVTDPYARTRSALLSAMVILLIVVVAWTLIKRRRVESRAADQRAIYFQKHYGEYSEVRENIEMALASDVTWLKAAEVLEDFSEKRLEAALTPHQWTGIQQLAIEQKAREALEALDRAIARLEG